MDLMKCNCVCMHGLLHYLVYSLIMLVGVDQCFI